MTLTDAVVKSRHEVAGALWHLSRVMRLEARGRSPTRLALAGRQLAAQLQEIADALHGAPEQFEGEDVDHIQRAADRMLESMSAALNTEIPAVVRTELARDLAVAAVVEVRLVTHRLLSQFPHAEICHRDLLPPGDDCAQKVPR